jgi:hypothetical protein
MICHNQSGEVRNNASKTGDHKRSKSKTPRFTNMEALLNVLTLKSQVKKTKWGNMFENKYGEVQAILAFKTSCFTNRVFKVSSFTQWTITAV